MQDCNKASTTVWSINTGPGNRHLRIAARAIIEHQHFTGTYAYKATGLINKEPSPQADGKPGVEIENGKDNAKEQLRASQRRRGPQNCRKIYRLSYVH